MIVQLYARIIKMKLMHDNQTIICTITGMIAGLFHYVNTALFIPRTLNQTPLSLEVISGVVLVSLIGAACSFIATEFFKYIKSKWHSKK